MSDHGARTGALRRGTRVTYHSAFSTYHSRLRRAAFSMAELMIAIIILGIGLLITSSMFPIAWYKAREVAEAAVIPALANAGEVSLKLSCRPSRPQPNPSTPVHTSSFFPGDWFPASNLAGVLADVYPDTRVHHLNAGNYLADTREDVRTVSGITFPVADNSWTLEDNLDLVFDTGWISSFVADSDVSRGPQVRAHARLSPPMEARPLAADNPDPLVVRHWEERFETRRHCWSVFYKFNELPGLEYAVAQDPVISLPRKYELANQRLKQPRTLTAYFFTLKRPVGARYARQAGYDIEDPSSMPIDPADPVALPSTEDVLLPVPWRFEATLVALPSASIPGVPSEIFVPRATSTNKPNFLADVLDVGFILLDDRTGHVIRITNRREVTNPEVGVVFTLDRDYTVAETEQVVEYEPAISANVSGPTAAYNWAIAGQWKQSGCDVNPGGCSLALENEPERRFFWVFLPPVDPLRGPNNSPLFDGSQPVVGVELRQITL